MLGAQGLARDPFAGRTALINPSSGQVTPPTVPDGTTTYTYTAGTGARPLAFAGLAGGGAQATYPGGGIVLVPDPVAGVMRVIAWWPDTTGVLVLRMTPDGRRTPVRGGYPLATGTATRVNFSTNPGVEVSTAGYAGVEGSPTLSRRAVTSGTAGTAGTQVLRATVAGAGSIGVTLAHALTVTSSATVGFGLSLSARASAVSVVVGYNNASGGALTAVSAALTADQINAALGQFSRMVVTVVAPVTAATVTTIKILATGMPAGGYLELDALTIEQGPTTGSAFDGSTLGGVWTGTADLSTSKLAPVLTLLDGECPMDIPVSYEVSSPSITGGRVQSATATLSSGGSTWLTHPRSASTPVIVQPSRPTPPRDHVAVQGIFNAIGRRRPVVVSAAQRQSATGSISFGALSTAERVALLALFEDLSPLLLRTPAGYDPGDMWLSLGTLTVDPQNRLPWQETRLLTAPFVEVDPPDPSIAT